MTMPRAKEAIIKTAGLALRSRRNTTTSDAIESSAPTPSTESTISQLGRAPSSIPVTTSVEGIKRAKTQNAMYWPWAKLISRMTPKINAMPSAPSA